MIVVRHRYMMVNDDKNIGDSTTGVVQNSKLTAQLNDGSIIGAWYNMMVVRHR